MAALVRQGPASASAYGMSVGPHQTTIGQILKGCRAVSAAIEGLGKGARRRPIVLADIGGRGGLRRAWNWLWRAGVIAPVFFEPDPQAAAAIAKRYPSASIIEAALWSAAGRASLKVTTEPGCSSLLLPSPDARMPGPSSKVLAKTGELDVPVQRADTEFAKLNLRPEIVKIDVQGGELEVLQGFGSTLDTVCCCELEVWFMRGYKDQPLFANIYEFMIDNGFGLFHAQVFGVLNTRNGVHANAFFCRRSLASKRQVLVENIFRKVSGFCYWP